MKFYSAMVLFKLILVWIFPLNINAQSEQIRSQILKQKTFLSYRDTRDNSLGVPWSGNSPEEFKSKMLEMSHEELERLRGSTMWIMGYEMGAENRIRKTFEQVLKDLNLADLQIKIEVLTVPANLIQNQSVGLAKDILQRVIYSMPSIKRDFQKPQYSEVVGELTVASGVAVPTFVFFFTTLDPIPAALTLTSHAVLISSMAIFSKSMLNWMLREGFSSARMNAFQLFLKQIAMSIPFAITFNLMPHAQEVSDFLINSPWTEIVSRTTYESGHFLVEQSLGMVLQAMFYSQVIINGLGNWVAKQKTEDASIAARGLRPWFALPLLAADGFLFAISSSNWGGYISNFPLQLNSGHIGLLALTIGAGYTLQKYSGLLDHFIPLYQSVHRRFSGLRAGYCEEVFFAR